MMKSINYKKIWFLATMLYVFTFLFIPFPAVSEVNDQLILLNGENLVEQTNAQRKARSIHYLKLNDELNVAAQLKADDMASSSYFSHISPAGVTPWSWFYKAGYVPEKAGENLAVVPIGEKGVVRAWMNSPLHRENVLRLEFQDIGFGAARGVYEGRDVWFVVQMFGKKL